MEREESKQEQERASKSKPAREARARQRRRARGRASPRISGRRILCRPPAQTCPTSAAAAWRSRRGFSRSRRPAERRPGVSDIAMMEQRLSMMDVFDGTEARRAFYQAWGETVPSSWTSPSSMSTVNGGVWIWRYEAMLLMLAEARAFGLREQAKRCDRWLLDVSRIQARLGELRTIHAVRRGGVLLAIAGLVIGSGPVQLPFVVGSALVALTAHVVHRRRTPPPF